MQLHALDLLGDLQGDLLGSSALTSLNLSTTLKLTILEYLGPLGTETPLPHNFQGLCLPHRVTPPNSLPTQHPACLWLSHLCPLHLLAPPGEPALAQLHPPEILLAAPR